MFKNSLDNCYIKTAHFNPFPRRAAKSVPFFSLLCLAPDDFTRQRRAPGWEGVKREEKLTSWKI